jgi:hypothetical protein
MSRQHDLMEDGKCGKRGHRFRYIAQSRRLPGLSPTAAVDPFQTFGRGFDFCHRQASY